jgi:polygalacturonase
MSSIVVNIRDFGAIADSEAVTTRYLQSAIDACAAAGGGTVHVPAGRYVVGTLWLRSHITLNLDAGAVLLGSQNVDDFPIWTSQWEGARVKPRRAALLCGEGLENVAVTGRGTIDGRGQMWWALQRAAPRDQEVLRPLIYRLVDSKNLLIRDITLKNAPMWTISPLACDNVTIDAVTIQNPADSPNTDGINPDSCRNVRISNCHVDVGDDCITIKSGKEDDRRRELRACENITITNCTLLHGHGGIVFGSEMSGSVRNVTISNCVLVGTDRGLRFKSRRGRGGIVQDVCATNLVMDGVLCPIAVNLFYGCGAWGEKKVSDSSAWPVDSTTPRFCRFRFSNITARNIKVAAGCLVGLPEMPVEDVVIDNCSFHVDADNREPGDADMSPLIPPQCRAGFSARRVNQLTLRNIRISDQLGPAISLFDVRQAHLGDLDVEATEAQAIQLENVTLRKRMSHAE